MTSTIQFQSQHLNEKVVNNVLNKPFSSLTQDDLLDLNREIEKTLVYHDSDPETQKVQRLLSYNLNIQAFKPLDQRSFIEFVIDYMVDWTNENIDTITPLQADYIFDAAMADGTMTYNKIKSINYIHAFWDDFLEDDINCMDQASDIFTYPESFLVYQSLYMCERLIYAICDGNNIQNEDKKNFYLDPNSPDFITNNKNLKNPIKEPIILNKLCTDPNKPFTMRESLSDIIDGNIRFKPQYIVNQLKKSLADMGVEVEQHVVLKNTIIIKYLFETTENDAETYHQVTIGLTPLANNIDYDVKENDVQITFENQINYGRYPKTNNDFSPKFRFFEINSDEDLNKLIDLITTLVVNDIHFTKTLKRLKFEELY